MAQDLNVSNNPPFDSVDFLLNNVFTNDDCILIENFTFNGTPNQIGFFNNGASSITAGAGLVIATSNITAAIGPNDDQGFSEQATGLGGDPDLDDLLPGNSGLYDVAVLEFDFTPDEDNISFNYVFASDEYPEYVCTQFNDVFGFFLSGPGINGPYSNNAQNIAALANGDIVAINSVNSGDVGAIANGNAAGCDNLNNDEFYVDNDGGSLNTQYDGFTTVLTASADVVPCETYHIKIAIADVGDPWWDSAVFLEAESFGNGSGTFSTTIGTDGPIDSQDMIEGCVDGYILFQRGPGSPLSQDVEIEIAPASGTATSGIDYSPAIPENVTIPAGQSSVQIDFSAIADNLDEGTEDIVIQILTTNCACDPFEEYIISIVDNSTFELEDFDAVCSSETSALDLSDFVVDDEPGEWSGPGVLNNELDATTLSGEVELTFTPDNACMDPQTSTILVEDPTVPVVGDIPNLCTSTADLVDLTQYDDPDIPGTWSGVGVSSNTFVPVGITGTVELTYTPSGACSAPAMTEISIVDTIIPDVDSFDPMCEGDGVIDLTDFGDSTVPGVWSGDGISGNEFDPSGLEGDILLTYTPDDDCGQNAFEEITVLPVVVPDLIPFPDFCELDGLIDLTDFEDDDVDGEWEVDGNSDDMIDADGNAGTIPVIFTPDAPCSEPVELELVIAPLVETSLADPPTPCEGSTTLIDLSELEEDVVDATWSGDGVVNDDQFDPTGLSGTVELTYTLDDPCSEPIELEIEFIESIDLSLSDLPLVCADNAPDVDLEELLSENVAGVWSGPGISNDEWNAQGLEGEVTLTFTPDDDCADEVEISTTILEQPVIEISTPNCISASTYEVEILITGEAGATYILSSDDPDNPGPDELEEGVSEIYVFTNDEDLYTVEVEQEDADNCIDAIDIITPICDCPTADPIQEELVLCGEPSDIDLDQFDPSNLENEDYLNTDDSDGNGIDWFDIPDPNVGDDVVDVSSYNWPGDPCEASEVSFYPFLRCDLLQDGFDGSSDDVYVPIGEFALSIYPDISDLSFDINTDSECCPFVQSFDCEDLSFFSIVNDFDNNGAEPDCSDETGVGEIVFTITNESLPAELEDSDCFATTTSVSYSCLNCPSVVNEASGLQIFCDSDDADLDDAVTGLEVESAIAPSEVFISWHFEDDPDSEIYEPGTLISSDLCASEIFEIFAFLNCDLEGDGFDGGPDDTSSPAGSILIEVFPGLENLTLEIENEGECCPFVSSWDCSDIDGFEISNDYDDEGEMPDCSDEELSGQINFVITNTNLPTELAGSDCESIETPAFYNCTDCPSVIQAAESVQYFCGEIAIDFSDPAATVTFEAPTGNNVVTASWWVEEENSSDITPFIEGSLAAAEGCDPVEYIVYAYLECDIDGDGFDEDQGDSFVAAGFIEVVAYPSVENLSITIDTDNACCPVISDWDCMDHPDYGISNDYDDGGAEPDCSEELESGGITFTIEHSNLPDEITDAACQVQSVSTGFDCTECPQVTPIEEALDFCESDDTPLTDLPAPTIATPTAPAMVELAYFLDNGATPSQTYVPGLLVADACETKEEVVYAYVLCDLNGDGFNGQADDNYIFAGEISIVVYPSLSQPQLVQEDDCSYSISTDCPDDIIDPSDIIEVELGSDASTLDVNVMSANTETVCPDINQTLNIPACPEFIEVEIEIPTAFSPNGDGINDVFRPITRNVKDYELHIFNRWGTEVYTSFIELNLEEAAQKGWDGTYQSEECDIGVFAFYLVARDFDDEKTTLQGNVTLIR